MKLKGVKVESCMQRSEVNKNTERETERERVKRVKGEMRILGSRRTWWPTWLREKRKEQ